MRRIELFSSVRSPTTKRTIAWAKRRLRQINPNVKIESTKFVLSKSPLQCKCLRCKHKWLQSWSELQRGRGCRKCGQRKASDSVKLTQQEVVRRLAQITGSIQIVGNYTGAMKPLKCVCKTCKHAWYPIWAELNRGHGCPKCARVNSMLTASEIAQRIRFKNITTLDVYAGAATSTRCICKICRYRWRAHWRDIVRKDGRGSGCPRCADSANEKEARSYLERITGWQFPKCRPSFLKGFGKYPMELDGYNEEHRLGFEYQGQQHYSPLRHWGGSAAFAAQKKRDDRKRHLCTYHGVQVIRIPYWVRDTQAFVSKKLQQLGVI